VSEDGSDDSFSWLDRSAAWSLREARRNGLVVLLVPLTVGGLVAIGFQLGRPLAAIPLALACGIVAWTHAAMLRVRGFSTRYEEAFAQRDLEAIKRLRRLWEGETPRTPAEHALRHIGDAELLLRLERWEEARDAYAMVDPELVPPIARPGVLGARGFSTAHAGDPTAGVAMLEQAASDAALVPRYPEDKRWHLRTRLGIALSLAQRHEEAVALLAPLLEDDEDDDRATVMARRALCESRAALTKPTDP
jgi:hypothetical protein